jgi:hypothetical protein
MAGFARVYASVVTVLAFAACAIGLWLIFSGDKRQAAEGLRDAMGAGMLGGGVALLGLALIVGLLGEIADTLSRQEERQIR